MVAAVAEHGYEATSVAELVRLSGVSRSAFYRHFSDKRECFLATLQEVLAEMGKAVTLRYDGRGSAFRAVLDLIANQPAAARLCFVEVYPAGPDAIALMDTAVSGVEDLFAMAFEARGAQMPDELVRAIVGGLRRVIYTSLLNGSESELVAQAPELWSWGFGYQAPPKSLHRRKARRRPPDRRELAQDPADRIVAGAAAAIAEHGYPKTTLSDIVERAGVSLSTFYANFGGKEAAFWAALDDGQARMFARMMPVYRRTRPQGWAQAIRAGCEAMLAFLAAEPDFTRLAIVETYNAGSRAMELRNRTVLAIRPYIEQGHEEASGVSKVADEAIPGAVSALIYNQLHARGPESLPEIAPMITYLVLAPFLGAEDACAIARGER
jgi:AcrR family transcriptional regulator